MAARSRPSAPSRRPALRRPPVRTRKKKNRLRRLIPGAATRRRAWRALRGLPAVIQLVMWVLAALVMLLLANTAYQVIRKPSELFFPVSGVLDKTPSETWRSYAPIFRGHSTAVMTPTLLAALAQAEGAGNPVARTYWRWRWSLRPFEVYRPASSSVGMYQMTDGTFAEARRLCIHEHAVVTDGAWDDWHSCWFNSLYSRVVPSHAVELTAAYLDLQVTRILARSGVPAAGMAQRQHLAAVVHLCGAGAGDLYARRGFRFDAGARCGGHDPRLYVARIDALQHVFSRTSAAG